MKKSGGRATTASDRESERQRVGIAVGNFSNAPQFARLLNFELLRKANVNRAYLQFECRQQGCTARGSPNIIQAAIPDHHDPGKLKEKPVPSRNWFDLPEWLVPSAIWEHCVRKNDS